MPLAGLEPACLAATDFESVASTNFATGAAEGVARRWTRLGQAGAASVDEVDSLRMFTALRPMSVPSHGDCRRNPIFPAVYAQLRGA